MIFERRLRELWHDGGRGNRNRSAIDAAITSGSRVLSTVVSFVLLYVKTYVRVLTNFTRLEPRGENSLQQKGTYVPLYQVLSDKDHYMAQCFVKDHYTNSFVCYVWNMTWIFFILQPVD
jgi:hypothetical protein